jgi:hypothetical protein
MKLILKDPSISLCFAEYKGPDTLGGDLIKAKLFGIFGGANCKNVGRISQSNFSVTDSIYEMN